jgi:hypothetical protein
MKTESKFFQDGLLLQSRGINNLLKNSPVNGAGIKPQNMSDLPFDQDSKRILRINEITSNSGLSKMMQERNFSPGQEIKTFYKPKKLDSNMYHGVHINQKRDASQILG